MVKVSGVPYEVDLPKQSLDDLIAELERENFMLRARNDRLEDQIKFVEEQVNKLNIELINERNRNASRTD